jgi:hypothetical protein
VIEVKEIGNEKEIVKESVRGNVKEREIEIAIGKEIGKESGNEIGIETFMISIDLPSIVRISKNFPRQLVFLRIMNLVESISQELLKEAHLIIDLNLPCIKE